MSQLISIAKDAIQTPDVVKLDNVLEEVAGYVVPVWPLKDYVAVNPYFGLADRSFMSARNFLRAFSDCETLMPLPYYAAQWHAGRITQADIEAALGEIHWPAHVKPVEATELVQLLQQVQPSEAIPAEPPVNPARPIRCIVEHASSVSTIDWQNIVADELSKFCAIHFDEGQASWGSSLKAETLYRAWHKLAQVDRNAEFLGLKGMRQFVASLPEEPQAAIAELLSQLSVPYPLWSTVLLSQVYSMPGWFAWARYNDTQTSNTSEPQAFVGLLAMRLAYDVAVGQTLDLEVDWHSFLRNGYASFPGEVESDHRVAWMRYALLCASEIHYRRNLLSSLPQQLEKKSVKAASQMVFCIDVRSERIRRHIESLSDNVETFGFAGFFGLPIAFLPLGEEQPTSQLPVLLKPQHCVHECLANASSTELAKVMSRRTRVRWWRKLWQSFKGTSISSFGFVETSGLLAGWQLVRHSLGWAKPIQHQRDGVPARGVQLRPSARAGHPDSMSLEQQVEIAARVLKNLGLTQGFARLVVLCGHFSQTHNNPLARV